MINAVLSDWQLLQMIGAPPEKPYEMVHNCLRVQ